RELLKGCVAGARPRGCESSDYLLAGTVFGLLWPGACAGLPDGNCPGGKLADDGAIRSSSLTMRNRSASAWRGSIRSPPEVERITTRTTDQLRAAARLTCFDRAARTRSG